MDMPNANRMTVGIMAVIAEEERRMISERTKAPSVSRWAAGRAARRSMAGSAPRPSTARHKNSLRNWNRSSMIYDAADCRCAR